MKQNRSLLGSLILGSLAASARSHSLQQRTDIDRAPSAVTPERQGDAREDVQPRGRRASQSSKTNRCRPTPMLTSSKLALRGRGRSWQHYPGT